MTRAIALSLICAVAALTATGCGESAGAGGDADPAALVPASAPIYAEAAVQPTGERREDALAAAGKLLRTGDPAGKLRQLIDDGLAENGGGLTWEKDFAPWLGEEAGVWASNLEAQEPSWAVIVATKDAGAAETALGRFREDDPGAASQLLRAAERLHQKDRVHRVHFAQPLPHVLAAAEVQHRASPCLAVQLEESLRSERWFPQ